MNIPCERLKSQRLKRGFQIVLSREVPTMSSKIILDMIFRLLANEQRLLCENLLMR